MAHLRSPGLEAAHVSQGSQALLQLRHVSNLRSCVWVACRGKGAPQSVRIHGYVDEQAIVSTLLEEEVLECAQ